MFAACALISCSCDSGEDAIIPNELISQPGQPVLSPSGRYEAIVEKFDDEGVRSYKLSIIDTASNDETKYTTDVTFRARDTNFVLWADEEDVLWGYNGDIGTFFWVNINGSWLKRSYANNSDVTVPEALKAARPRYFD